MDKFNNIDLSRQWMDMTDGRYLLQIRTIHKLGSHISIEQI